MIDWLAGTFVATSLLMALVLVLREPVRRLFGPGVAYALWLLPAARAVLPSFTETVERVVPASTGTVVHAAARFSSAPVQPTSPAVDWFALLLALWLAGSAVMLVRGVITYRAQRRVILDGAVQLARLDGIRILRSEKIRGPLAFGIIDRVIVLPLDFDQTFSDRQRCLALEHELAHHRSGDLFANLFAYVLLCLQWFNPLAWAAHSAFRFDQEAACDARVLDKAQPGERASYGAAIAKAASGRTLLFSGALDRPSTLSRRLKIMTRFPSSRARALGFALVGAAVVVALPTTATKAIEYVDVRSPAAPKAPSVPAAPAAALLAQVAPPVPPSPPAPPAPPPQTAMFNVTNDDTVTIDGVTKRWEDLTPAERAKIRVDLAKARREVQESLANLPQELARARAETDKFRNGEFQREMAKAREEIRRAMSEVDAQHDHLRKAGVDPEALKADIQRSLAEIEKMDIDKIVREALASVDMDKIRAEMQGAERSLDEVERKLEATDPN